MVDKAAENISQEDTSDGQGRDSSAHLITPNSPEHLSSPKMPLSPMASNNQRTQADTRMLGTCGFIRESQIGAACESNESYHVGSTLSYY